MRIFAPAFETNVSGVIAQLVEQRTENPCVPGSIPGGTTENPCVPGSIPGGTTEKKRRKSASFVFISINSYFCPILITL